MDRREMLAEYFALTISDSGLVKSLPLLLRDYIPNLDNLPSFLMRLGPQVSIHPSSCLRCLPHLIRKVDWSSEAECFDTFLRELAYFYTPVRLGSPSKQSTEEGEDQYKAERWEIQHILFLAMRRYLIAPKSLLDRDVLQVASLPELYKVFERC